MFWILFTSEHTCKKFNSAMIRRLNLTKPSIGFPGFERATIVPLALTAFDKEPFVEDDAGEGGVLVHESIVSMSFSA